MQNKNKYSTINKIVELQEGVGFGIVMGGIVAILVYKLPTIIKGIDKLIKILELKQMDKLLSNNPSLKIHQKKLQIQLNITKNDISDTNNTIQNPINKRDTINTLKNGICSVDTAINEINDYKRHIITLSHNRLIKTTINILDEQIENFNSIRDDFDESLKAIQYVY